MNVDGTPTVEVQPGTRVSVALPGLSGGVARVDARLAIGFQYYADGAWRNVPGSQTVTQRFYSILRAPALSPSTQTGAPYLAWVHFLDKVATWSNGTATNDLGLMNVVTRQIYASQGLRYDRTSGAPWYSTGSPSYSTFDLAAYDVQYNGVQVNCTDCANLVTIHARMVGVDAKNEYLGYNFPLHWIKGIGWDWTNALFQGGGHSFSFHSVATSTSGSTIHDACLAVDGDAYPSSSPFQEALPQGMTFQRYHDALTPGSFQGRALDRSRFQ